MDNLVIEFLFRNFETKVINNKFGEGQFICPPSLIIVLPLSLCSVFVVPNKSSLSATSGFIKFKALPKPWLLFIGFSPRRSNFYLRVRHLGFLLRYFALSRMILKTSFSPLIVIPTIYEINIAFNFPQNHTVRSLSNEINFLSL